MVGKRAGVCVSRRGGAGAHLHLGGCVELHSRRLAQPSSCPGLSRARRLMQLSTHRSWQHRSNAFTDQPRCSHSAAVGVGKASSKCSLSTNEASVSSVRSISRSASSGSPSARISSVTLACRRCPTSASASSCRTISSSAAVRGGRSDGGDGGGDGGRGPSESLAKAAVASSCWRRAMVSETNFATGAKRGKLRGDT